MYKDGEEPLVGDRVQCVDPIGLLILHHQYVVSVINSGHVGVGTDPEATYWHQRFELIRRAQPVTVGVPVTSTKVKLPIDPSALQEQILLNDAQTKSIISWYFETFAGKKVELIQMAMYSNTITTTLRCTNKLQQTQETIDIKTPVKTFKPGDIEIIE